MIEQQSISDFLQELAAKKSTPGGGSAAAISGAMAAALLSMVANFTIGKQGYEAVADEFIDLLQKTEDLRKKLILGIQEDSDAFSAVMAAYRLPKTTTQEQQQKQEQMQQSLKQATDVPVTCADLCRQLIELSHPMAEKGNTMVITDAGVAVMNAYAGLQSAALNVRINIGSIKDTEFVADRQQKLAKLLDGSEALTKQVYQIVAQRL